MKPWVLLGEAAVPGDGETMRLYRRDEEFSIRVENYELMTSRSYGSEVALAEVGCGRLTNRDRARVLIGGLGMGFTLAAVLSEVGPRAEVVVAELVPEVVGWNRVEMAEVNGAALEDRRVTVRVADVGAVIRGGADAWDAILLDVDNGPAALTAKKNDRIYTPSGLRAAYSALRPGGVLGIWSSAGDAEFTERLRQVGFDVEEVPVRGHGRGGSRYLVWIAQR